MWIITGLGSVVMTIATWIFAFKNSGKRIWSTIMAIFFMAFTLLMEYQLVFHWVQTEDWVAMADVVPTMFLVLSGYTILILLLNIIAVCRKKTDGGK